MHNKTTWVLLSVSFLLITACEQKREQASLHVDSSPIIAKAAGINFYESDIDREIQSMPESLQHLGSDPVARGRILDVLIRRSVLSRQAGEIGLESDPLIQSRINRARNTILIEALESWQLSQMPTPTEIEIKAYYKQHLIDFTTPEQIHARHILLGKEKLAWQILEKLKKSRDNFALLAATHSLDDSNRSRGGDLNWFPRGMMVETFEKSAFSLKVNSLSNPVKTRFGWHIIELLGKRPAHIRSLDESRDEITSLLQQQRLEKWISELTSRADLSILKPEYQTEASKNSLNQ